MKTPTQKSTQKHKQVGFNSDAQPESGSIKQSYTYLSSASTVGRETKQRVCEQSALRSVCWWAVSLSDEARGAGLTPDVPE